MPTYVYKFDTGETIEVQQAFTEEALTEAPHPSDGAPRPVRKVFTPVGITFKGNGFYKTDNRGKSSSSSGSGSTATTTTAESSGSSGSSGTSGASESSSSTTAKPDNSSNGSHSHSH